MNNLYSFLLLPVLLVPLLSPGGVSAQDDCTNFFDPAQNPANCCVDATCTWCWEVECCQNNPIYTPQDAMLGGTEVCGVDLIPPVPCSSFTENNALGGICLPSCNDPLACNYDPASPNDVDCDYPEFCEDCAGNAAPDIDGDGLCDKEDNCTDTTSFTYANAGNIECLYYGCVNPTADNYDPDPSVFGCEFGIDLCCIWNGCTDGTWTDGTPPACNYDPEANVDDGSCEYTSCAGCTDGNACNFALEAVIDDGTCDYACNGCTDPCSPNFDADATIDDGSCQSVLGCTVESACNYDPCADWNYGCLFLDACGVCGGSGEDLDDDGICDDVDPCVGTVDACGVCNGPGAIFECGCSDIPEGDCDCEGNQANACGVCGGDCVLDLDGDGVCDDEEIFGCTYPNACNLDPLATQDDGSCQFPDTGFDCDGQCLADADGDGVCDGDELSGCTDIHALNYYPFITEEDGSCIYLEDFAVDCAVDCPDDCPYDVNYDGIVSVTDILQVLSTFGYICP